MNIKHEIKEKVLIVSIEGELISPQALDTDKKIIAIIEKEKKERVILNLSKVDFIDSTGLGILVSIRLYCKKNKIMFATVGVNEKIKRTFTVTEMTSFLNIHDTIDKLL